MFCLKNFVYLYILVGISTGLENIYSSCSNDNVKDFLMCTFNKVRSTAAMGQPITIPNTTGTFAQAAGMIELEWSERYEELSKEAITRPYCSVTDDKKLLAKIWEEGVIILRYQNIWTNYTSDQEEIKKLLSENVLVPRSQDSFKLNEVSSENIGSTTSHGETFRLKYIVADNMEVIGCTFFSCLKSNQSRRESAALACVCYPYNNDNREAYAKGTPCSQCPEGFTCSGESGEGIYPGLCKRGDSVIRADERTTTPTTTTTMSTGATEEKVQESEVKTGGETAPKTEGGAETKTEGGEGTKAKEPNGKKATEKGEGIPMKSLLSLIVTILVPTALTIVFMFGNIKAYWNRRRQGRMT